MLEPTPIAEPLDTFLREIVQTLHVAVSRGIQSADEHPPVTISLTLACAEYDRTLPLTLGDVRPAGIDLTHLRMSVEEIFWRMNRHLEFDASEMSTSSYLLRRSRGDDALVAIPIFPSRY